MIVTLNDDVESERGCEALMVLLVNRDRCTFSIKFADGLTREQLELIAEKLPSMMERAIAIHQRLM